MAYQYKGVESVLLHVNFIGDVHVHGVLYAVLVTWVHCHIPELSLLSFSQLGITI